MSEIKLSQDIYSNIDSLRSSSQKFSVIQGSINVPVANMKTLQVIQAELTELMQLSQMYQALILQDATALQKVAQVFRTTDNNIASKIAR